MNKLLLDTNIYGLLVIDSERKVVHQKIHESTHFFFGFDIIRKELRQTPKNLIFKDKNLRIDLLSLYDDVVQKTYPTDQEIELLAADYWKAYHEIGGRIPHDEIINDFLIVACATLKQLDIVVSEDKHTLLAEYPLQVYSLVNGRKRLRTPHGISYQKLKEILSV